MQPKENTGELLPKESRAVHSCLRAVHFLHFAASALHQSTHRLRIGTMKKVQAAPISRQSAAIPMLIAAPVYGQHAVRRYMDGSGTGCMAGGVLASNNSSVTAEGRISMCSQLTRRTYPALPNAPGLRFPA